ncbi:hypothetical protein LCGC14_2872120, partial [marine sediment metagenome]
MKYSDSFEKEWTFTTTTQTVYSDWFDISWANEFYSYVNYVLTENRNAEQAIITLERYTPLGLANVTVLTHGTKTTTAAVDEQYASAITYDANAAIGNDQKLGMRVRYKVVVTGT